jgi:DNA-binding NtrC family response regulator
VSWPPGSRVFVVDDERVIATTLVAILKLNGFSAKSFTCAQEALNEARLQAPDLLISDVVMPDISGIDLAILMTAQYPSCKVLLFSGQAATSDLLQAARDKGYSFPMLSKPVHPTALLSEVGTLAQQPEREPKQQHLRRRVGALAADSGLGAQEVTAGPQAGPQTVSTNDGLHGCSSRRL